MYLAEIHGKLSRENENKEDILTSNVFSFFKYADRKVFLFKFLELLNLEVSIEDAVQAEFHFWPSYENKTEPDLVITAGKYYLLFEAKYHSGFGEETPTKKHQLEREIDGGRREAKNLKKTFKIITVTTDNYFRPDIVQKIPVHDRPDLAWINWQRIAFLIFSILEQNPQIPLEARLFAEDFYKLLVKKNLRNFEGGNAFTISRNLVFQPGHLFFRAETAIYRGDFIGFFPALKNRHATSQSTGSLFFQSQHTFFQLTAKMDPESDIRTNPIFFRREPHE